MMCNGMVTRILTVSLTFVLSFTTLGAIVNVSPPVPLQFVFSGLPDIADSSSEMVLHQTLPSGCDLGVGLQGIWRARLMLLGLTLELLAYLKGERKQF